MFVTPPTSGFTFAPRSNSSIMILIYIWDRLSADQQCRCSTVYPSWGQKIHISTSHASWAIHVLNQWRLHSPHHRVAIERCLNVHLSMRNEGLFRHAENSIDHQQYIEWEEHHHTDSYKISFVITNFTKQVIGIGSLIQKQSDNLYVTSIDVLLVQLLAITCVDCGWYGYVGRFDFTA